MATMVIASAITLAVLLAVAGGVVARGSSHPATGTTLAAAPTARAPLPPPCPALPYQPCGQPPAPFTDGRACLPGHADFDGIAANGCEAASDFIPGTVLTPGHAIFANLVPADTVDVFRASVTDKHFHLCLGEFHVTLTAPPGVTDRVEIVRANDVLAAADSQDMQPATASASKPSCFHDDSGWLTIRVTGLQGQSAADFRLTRSGSW